MSIGMESDDGEYKTDYAIKRDDRNAVQKSQRTTFEDQDIYKVNDSTLDPLSAENKTNRDTLFNNNVYDNMDYLGPS